MKFYYAARAKYDKNCTNSSISWEKYIEWSRLTQLTELISVDSMLNEDLVVTDRNNESEYNYIVTDNYFETGFYTSLDFVLKKVSKLERFNLLAVVIEPDQKCELVTLDEFSFVGYDLIDMDYSISALSNCGGFDETFLPSTLNHFGLIDNSETAYEIKRRLLENNPEEYHADTNVIAIWRHLKIGQSQNKI